jgi:hypothetical protein
MPYALSYDPETDCIFGSIKGDFDQALVREYIQAMAELAKEKHCRRVLTDMRMGKPQLTVLEIDDLPRSAIEAGLNLTMRRALVVSSDFDDYAFYRATSAIRGQNIRVFRDMDSAKEWLYEDNREQE